MTELEISTGRLEGRRRHGTMLFAGIPYAAPPEGADRFGPPKPPTPWTGVRDAKGFGPMAWQRPSLVAGMAMTADGACDEACLSLNVVTPGTSGPGRPVLVWIHGGGFTGGTGATPWYDGTSFAAKGDVVVVTLNYRLGALGFLHLDELTDRYPSSGIAGLQDQIAALRWVRDEIRAFGGDPEQVTVFGESAGAMSIGCLLAMPEARGLFHRAVMQSGAAEATATPDEAAAVTSALLRELEISTIDSLLAAPAATIVDAQARLMDRQRRPGPATDGPGTSDPSMFSLPFRPVVDGSVLPEPLPAIAAGCAAEVDLVSGTNRDEFNIFLLMQPPDLDRARAIRRAERWLPGGAELFASYASRRPAATPLAVLAAIMTDAVFRLPSLRLLDAHSAGAPGRSHGYRFDWASEAFDGRLGAAHIVEIPFVWNNLDKSGVDLLLGRPGPPALAETMHSAWIRFASGHSPGHDGIAEWPAHDPVRRATMLFDETCIVVEDPAAEDRLAWATR